jgi:hypothetical protein
VGGGGASAAGDEAPLGATLVAKSEGQWREVQTRLSESLLHSKATADKLARFQGASERVASSAGARRSRVRAQNKRALP